VNILLVDDEPVIRRMMKSMLRSRRHQVLDASNAQAALALSEEHPIDLLVTDIVMEGMDGWALARALAARHPDLPILFVSGYPVDFETARRQFARCAFLPKPFLGDEFLKAIAALQPPANPAA